ncbi:hypothetical protein, partial [Methylobacterium sp. E-045]|uniref:hypothetical protein n=1 Tax=Methylobacterium sp. E-045 TaxID=2836575 RepID=UPI001FBABB19
DRYDRSIRVSLEAYMEGSDSLGTLIESLMALPTAKNLTRGIAITQTGDAEIMGEVFEGLALSMGTGLMMLFGVRVLLFGNFLTSLSILFSTPLSIARYSRMIPDALAADLEGSAALGTLIESVMALPTAKNLPPGIAISQTGDAEI